MLAIVFLWQRCWVSKLLTICLSVVGFEQVHTWTMLYNGMLIYMCQAHCIWLPQDLLNDPAVIPSILSLWCLPFLWICSRFATWHRIQTQALKFHLDLTVLEEIRWDNSLRQCFQQLCEQRGIFSFPHCPPMSLVLSSPSSFMPVLVPVVLLSNTSLGSQTSAHLHRVSSQESLSVSAHDLQPLLIFTVVFLLRHRCQSLLVILSF